MLFLRVTKKTMSKPIPRMRHCIYSKFRSYTELQISEERAIHKSMTANYQQPQALPRVSRMENH